MIPSSPQTTAKLVKKLDEPKSLGFSYESGPCGYGIYRELVAMGCSCMVDGSCATTGSEKTGREGQDGDETGRAGTSREPRDGERSELKEDVKGV